MKKSPEWKDAEWEYCALSAEMIMPGPFGRPTRTAVIRRLKSILGQCPQFYPALLDLGLRLLAENGCQEAERMIEKGFAIMAEG